MIKSKYITHHNVQAMVAFSIDVGILIHTRCQDGHMCAVDTAKYKRLSAILLVKYTRLLVPFLPGIWPTDEVQLARVKVVGDFSYAAAYGRLSYTLDVAQDTIIWPCRVIPQGYAHLKKIMTV